MWLCLETLDTVSNRTLEFVSTGDKAYNTGFVILIGLWGWVWPHYGCSRSYLWLI